MDDREERVPKYPTGWVCMPRGMRVGSSGGYFSFLCSGLKRRGTMRYVR